MRGLARAILGLAAALVVPACDGDLMLVDHGDAANDAAGGCTTDVQCKVSTLHCLPSVGECVQCTSDDHCASAAEGHRCDLATHRCVECGLATDCSDDSVCEATTHKCVVKCTTSSTCPTSAPRCDTSRGICVGCSKDADCTSSSTPNCEVASGRCMGCTSDANCSSGEKPRCNVSSGVCVDCLSSADCSDHLCDPSKHECVD